MSLLFKRDKLPKSKTEASHDSRVEVVVHQNATKEAVKDAKQAGEYLNKLLDENGITLTIYLAAVGKLKKPKGRSR